MAEAAYRGMLRGILTFYTDPRGSVRAMLDSRPSEAQILVFGVLACAILTARRIITISVLADDDTDVMGQISANLVSLMFLMPIFLYALAALGTLLARAFRGVGSWQDGRAAFFWAVLVSAPVVFLGSMVQLFVPNLPAMAFAALGQVGAVVLAWALAQTFAETFRFRRTWAVFAVICALVLLLLGVVLLTLVV